MKTKTKAKIVAGAVVITTLFTACPKEPNDPPKDCSCKPKDHLDYDATCGCGDQKCDCALNEIGKIGTRPVYKKGNVPNAPSTIVRANTEISKLDPNLFNTKVEAVVIITGSDSYYDNKPANGKWIITIGENITDNDLANIIIEVLLASSSSTTVKAHDGWTKLNRQVIANGNHRANQVARGCQSPNLRGQRGVSVTEFASGSAG